MVVPDGIARRPDGRIVNGKVTFHSESDQDAIDQPEISGGKGISPVIDRAGSAVPTGKCKLTHDVQLGNTTVNWKQRT